MSLCNECRYQLTSGHERCLIFPVATCEDKIKQVWETGKCKEFERPIGYIDSNNYIKVNI